MNNLAAHVYAEAFFELALENEKLDEYKNDLTTIQSVFLQHPELVDLLDNPNVSKGDKKDILNRLFDGLNDKSLNLMNVLVDKNRLNIFSQLTDSYNDQYNDHQGILYGTVYTVDSLENSEIKEIEDKLSKKYNKKVELINEIDKDLIGGLSIHMDGKIIDYSVKGKLDGLKRSLKKEMR